MNVSGLRTEWEQIHFEGGWEKHCARAEERLNADQVTQ